MWTPLQYIQNYETILRDVNFKEEYCDSNYEDMTESLLNPKH